MAGWVFVQIAYSKAQIERQQYPAGIGFPGAKTTLKHIKGKYGKWPLSGFQKHQKNNLFSEEVNYGITVGVDIQISQLTFIKIYFNL